MAFMERLADAQAGVCRRGDVPLLAVLLLSTALAGGAEAQGRSDCRSPQRPSVGAAFGRSAPYLDLAPEAAGVGANGSLSVRSSAQFVGRTDLPVAGMLRLRIEGATARWDVRERRYDPDAGSREIDDRSVGHMTARHLAGFLGVRGGWAPACGHVSAGGGLYSLGFRDASVRRAGFAIAAGIEIPTGEHGAVQADVGLHLIGTRNADPITSSMVPVANLVIGWAYRF